MLSKLKSLIGGFRFKSKCFSECCNHTEADIDIDIDGDGKKDLNIHIEDGEIEVRGHDPLNPGVARGQDRAKAPPKSPTLSDHMKAMGL